MAMPRRLVGAFLIAGLVIAAIAGVGATEPSFVGAAATSSAQGGELITHVTAPEGQPPMITVIDPHQRVMGVYFVDRATGEISLKSIRNFTWDLQMVQYNSGNPLPQDVRSGLQR
jgi:hypothetical protein